MMSDSILKEVGELQGYILEKITKPIKLTLVGGLLPGNHSQVLSVLVASCFHLFIQQTFATRQGQR